MNTIYKTLLLTLSISLISCGTSDEQTETPEIIEEVVNEVIEETVEEPVELSLSDKIMGKWQQTHQGCDEEGENGEEMSKDTYWEFNGTEVTWSSFTHPYTIENEQILIGEGEGSPYEVIKETDEFIVLKAVKRNRNMRLIKVVNE